PYDILDPILERYIEQNQTPQQITAAGFPSDTVEKILRLVDQNEHKRRQAPPGPRVTPKPLTRDRRYPITNAWK
ncbi:MAG: NAD+ synthase, partial [Cellvibrionales bacterium]|nr:NAD+ synthase [Cellvibrionales bacterium]